MYVVRYDDYPDVIVFSHSEMLSKLNEQGCIAAYEYRMDNTWVVQRKYFFLEEIECVDAGDWNIPYNYLTYNDPNKCSTCKETKFMQGTTCLNCTACDVCMEAICLC
jgi:hypothetical protein